MEIGLTAIVLVCKYMMLEGRRLEIQTLLRLFVTAANVAFKLSYELVSPNFLRFLADLIGVDLNTVHAL